MKKCPKGHENPDNANYCKICGTKFNDKPEIAEFYHCAEYKVGDVVNLTWKVANADTVMINGRRVSENANAKYKINGYTKFKLEAIKGRSHVEKNLTIIPQHNPRTSTESPFRTFSDFFLHNIIVIILAVISLLILLAIYCFGESLQYHFNFSYHGWQGISIVLKIIGWAMLGFCMAYLILNQYKNKHWFKKNT